MGPYKISSQNGLAAIIPIMKVKYIHYQTTDTKQVDKLTFHGVNYVKDTFHFHVSVERK